MRFEALADDTLDIIFKIPVGADGEHSEEQRMLPGITSALKALMKASLITETEDLGTVLNGRLFHQFRVTPKYSVPTETQAGNELDMETITAERQFVIGRFRQLTNSIQSPER